MAKAQSEFAQAVGAQGNAAIKEVRNNETVYDTSGDLPAGVEGGIAKVTALKIDKYKSGPNEGKFYFHAMGSCLVPKEFNGVPCEGRLTSIMRPLCETKTRAGKVTPFKDHVDWVLNQLRLLGADTSKCNSAGDIEVLVAGLQKLADADTLFTKFRTWKRRATKEFPNPDTQHKWNGATTFDGEIPTETNDNSADDGNVDLVALGELADNEDTEAQEQLQELAEEAGINPDDHQTWADVVTAMEGDGAEEGGDEETPEEPAEEETSLEEHAALADEDEEANADSVTALEAAAEEVGLDPNDYNLWSELAEAINEANGSSEPITPSKGDVYLYKPSGAKKAIECEVMVVFKPKKQVKLKNLDDGKTLYNNVKWDDLSDAE